MELRVHGVGGTTAASMLGQPPDAALVPRWPRGRGATPHVWRGSDPEVAAFHWAPLTSGSKWFVLWPLLLPFTLLNVAGFMYPRGGLGPVLRGVQRVLCIVATAWFATWLVFAAQVVARIKGWNPEVGLGLAALVAVPVVAPSWFRCRWPAGRATATGRPTRDLRDPGFFRTGRGLWAAHVLVLLGTGVGIVVAAWRDDGEGLESISGPLAVDLGIVVVALLWTLVVGTFLARLFPGRGERQPWAWAFRAAGASAFGAAMIGGLMASLLRVIVGGHHLRGAPYVLFDVYGWALLAALALGVTGAVVILGRRSPGELVAGHGSRLLPHPISWFRARVALLPRAAVLAVGAAVVTFLVVGTWLFAVRAPATVGDTLDRLGIQSGSWLGEQLDRVGVDADVTPGERADEASWRAGTSAPVRIAHFTIYGVFGVMFLNLVRSWGATDALRRVGNVWDVLTFWPGRFHPFAVRPYTECAVDQLREVLFTRVDDDWPDTVTVLAHSQGAMLVIAALAPNAAPDGADPSRRVTVDHLVTVGCPMRALYMKAFPAYVDEDLLDDVSGALDGEGRWSNVFRFTDHVGRTVFSEEVGWAPDRLPDAGDAQDRWFRNGHTDRQVDCAVADPISNQEPIRGHNDYWDDERVGKVVGRVPAAHS